MRPRISASSSVSRRPSVSAMGAGCRSRRRASCSSNSRTASARAAAIQAPIGVGAGWFCASRAMTSWAIVTPLTDTGTLAALAIAAWAEQLMAHSAGWIVRRVLRGACGRPLERTT